MLLRRPLLMRVMRTPVMGVGSMLALALGTLMSLAPLMIHDPP